MSSRRKDVRGILSTSSTTISSKAKGTSTPQQSPDTSKILLEEGTPLPSTTSVAAATTMQAAATTPSSTSVTSSSYSKAGLTSTPNPTLPNDEEEGGGDFWDNMLYQKSVSQQASNNPAPHKKYSTSTANGSAAAAAAPTSGSGRHHSSHKEHKHSHKHSHHRHEPADIEPQCPTCSCGESNCMAAAASQGGPSAGSATDKLPMVDGLEQATAAVLNSYFRLHTPVGAGPTIAWQSPTPVPMYSAADAAAYMQQQQQAAHEQRAASTLQHQQYMEQFMRLVSERLPMFLSQASPPPPPAGTSAAPPPTSTATQSPAPSPAAPASTASGSAAAVSASAATTNGTSAASIPCSPSQETRAQTVSASSASATTVPTTSAAVNPSPQGQTSVAKNVFAPVNPHPRPTHAARTVTFAPSPMPPAYGNTPGGGAASSGSPPPRTTSVPVTPTVPVASALRPHSSSPLVYTSTASTAGQQQQSPGSQPQPQESVPNEILLPLVDEFLKNYIRTLHQYAATNQSLRGCDTIEDEVKWAQAHAMYNADLISKSNKERPARPPVSFDQPPQPQPQPQAIYPSIPVPMSCSSPYPSAATAGCPQSGAAAAAAAAAAAVAANAPHTFMPVAMSYSYLHHILPTQAFPSPYGVSCAAVPQMCCGHHLQAHPSHHSGSRSHRHRSSHSHSHRKCCNCGSYDHPTALSPAPSKPIGLSSHDLQANCVRTRPDPSKSRPHLQSVRSAFSSASGSTKSCSTMSCSSSYAGSTVSQSTRSSWSSRSRSHSSRVTQSTANGD